MSGDKLSFLLFFVGTAIAAVMGGVQSTGARAKALWIGAVVFAALACAYYRYSASGNWFSVLLVVWSLGPLVATVICSIIVSGREPRKVEPKRAQSESETAKATLNPALTPEFLNELIKGSTELEAKNRLSEHSNQLMRLAAEVSNIREAAFQSSIAVYVLGLYKKYSDPLMNDTVMYFDKSQHDALKVIKRGDFIDFTGRVEHGGSGGWYLVDCVFNGRADPPSTSKPKRAKGTQS